MSWSKIANFIDGLHIESLLMVSLDLMYKTFFAAFYLCRC